MLWSFSYVRFLWQNKTSLFVTYFSLNFFGGKVNLNKTINLENRCQLLTSINSQVQTNWELIRARRHLDWDFAILWSRNNRSFIFCFKNDERNHESPKFVEETLRKSWTEVHSFRKAISLLTLSENPKEYYKKMYYAFQRVANRRSLEEYTLHSPTEKPTTEFRFVTLGSNNVGKTRFILRLSELCYKVPSLGNCHLEFPRLDRLKNFKYRDCWGEVPLH